MIVLNPKHKKVFTTRGNCSQSPEIPFFVFTQVIVSAVLLYLVRIIGRNHPGGVNHIGKNILGLVNPNGKDGSFIHTDIRFIIGVELWP